ncbi:PD-(D/E)XK nuclease superfamily protein [Flexibacter flexilis DSM 6793]|uniref:PD-(D/E)XK nuclease superfamily protein n=1 Tax=Flexibacter flexilis DSM 6793 TaxID=927664 RepID=A0A1I1MQJ0_9BACT|nr:PD-(D/E)XK nuclease family protein [Flexibacter flexilis]SFC87445.1 PD-(D/E)XK nuclease superfamily protein [Flexibacter flexilis DSM 6793]
MENLQKLEAVQERDMDILILEELECNENFRTHFTNQLHLPEMQEYEGAWRSVTDSTLGETDILVKYISSENQVICLLIENKIDANFQPEQFARYEKRGLKYLQSNECDAFFCILIAPQKYISNQSDFEICFSYENLMQLIASEATPRAAFRANLVQIAIEKSRRGYQAENCEVVQRFWMAYWEYKEANYPLYAMKKPESVPEGSDFIVFSIRENEKLKFRHKLRHGFVEVTIPKEFGRKPNISLPDHYFIKEFDKGAFAIRQVVPKLNRKEPFENQVAAVQVGLAALDQMVSFMKENHLYL